MGLEARFGANFIRSSVIAVFFVGSFSGCALMGSRSPKMTSKEARLESRLRKANARIENLRETNWVLKKKIRILKANEGVDPETAAPVLAAFPEGAEMDVPISPTSGLRRENASVGVARKERSVAAVQLSAAAAPATESADRVLARTVTELLNSGDELEADRTALLLAKSYPESELVAVTRFEQGLYHFRRRRWSQADRYFRSSLMAPKATVRARAGAALMRGVIVQKALTENPPKAAGKAQALRRIEAAQKSFDFVIDKFPKTPEAARARRETSRLARLMIVEKK